MTKTVHSAEYLAAKEAERKLLDPKKKVERFAWNDEGKYAVYTDGTESPILRKVKPVRDDIKQFIVKPKK